MDNLTFPKPVKRFGQVPPLLMLACYVQKPARAEPPAAETPETPTADVAKTATASGAESAKPIPWDPFMPPNDGSRITYGGGSPLPGAVVKT